MSADSTYLNRNIRSEAEARSDIKRDTDSLDAWRAKHDAQALTVQRNANAALQQFRTIVELFEAPGSGLK